MIEFEFNLLEIHKSDDWWVEVFNVSDLWSVDWSLLYIGKVENQWHFDIFGLVWLYGWLKRNIEEKLDNTHFFD